MGRFKIFSLLLLSLSFLGCDALDELLEEEFDVSVSFNRVINIDIQPTGNPEEPVNFMESAVVNLTTAPELDEFRERDDATELKSLAINRIRYFYKDVNGNTDTVVVAEFQIPLIVSDPEVLEVQQINLMNAETNPNPFIIDGDFTNINNVLNNLTGFSILRIDYIGQVSDNPIEFTVDVTIDATLTLEIQV